MNRILQDKKEAFIFTKNSLKSGQEKEEEKIVTGTKTIAHNSTLFYCTCRYLDYFGLHKQKKSNLFLKFIIMKCFPLCS